MPTDRTEKARRIIIGKSFDWVKRFDVNEYVQNPPMIEKLYEEKQLALTTSIDFGEKIKELESRVHELVLDNQRLKLEVGEKNQKASLIFTLSLLATILIAIGVNIATSSVGNWTGWVMIIAGCILEVLAFLSKAKKDN